MFPERLRALRKGQNLTLNELAQALNEHLGPGERPNTPTQIGNWERGIRNPSFVEVRKVAEFFDVSMDYLCGRTDAMVTTWQNFSSQIKTCCLKVPS